MARSFTLTLDTTGPVLTFGTPVLERVPGPKPHPKYFAFVVPYTTDESAEVVGVALVNGVVAPLTLDEDSFGVVVPSRVEVSFMLSAVDLVGNESSAVVAYQLGPAGEVERRDLWLAQRALRVAYRRMLIAAMAGDPEAAAAVQADYAALLDPIPPYTDPALDDPEAIVGNQGLNL